LRIDSLNIITASFHCCSFRDMVKVVFPLCNSCKEWLIKGVICTIPSTSVHNSNCLFSKGMVRIFLVWLWDTIFSKSSVSLYIVLAFISLWLYNIHFSLSNHLETLYVSPSFIMTATHSTGSCCE